jgi:hypothetical protein
MHILGFVGLAAFLLALTGLLAGLLKRSERNNSGYGGSDFGAYE